MVYTKLRQVEKFNCPVPSAKKFNLKVGFLWANFTQMSALMLENFYRESV